MHWMNTVGCLMYMPVPESRPIRKESSRGNRRGVLMVNDEVGCECVKLPGGVMVTHGV